MENEKRKLTEKEIIDLKSNYVGQCSGCGKKLSSYNMSNDGDTCTDCYKEEN